MTKAATPEITIIYFQSFPGAPLAEFGWLVWLSCGKSVGECSGAANWFCFLLASGTAGKDPLLMEIGIRLICIAGSPLKGAAARLLDWSSNLRRAELIRFDKFGSISDSSEPTWCKVCFQSQLKAYFSVSHMPQIQSIFSTHYADCHSNSLQSHER